jgi:hypothetical protein
MKESVRKNKRYSSRLFFAEYFTLQAQEELGHRTFLLDESAIT